MFTGIVQSTAPVVSLSDKQGIRRLELQCDTELVRDLKTGASVAVDGVCLTVVANKEGKVSFDVIGETLSLTTLGQLQVSDRVNIERSLRYGDEVGGHILSGHVDARVQLLELQHSEDNLTAFYAVPPLLRPYLYRKGFVALNGCSLTVAWVAEDKSRFSVCFIPETLRATTHGQKQAGDELNIEIDRQTQIISDQIERILAERLS